MEATNRQKEFITKLMGDTYKAEYGKLTVKTASLLISAILTYKRPILRGNADAMLAHAYENLCHAEIVAFGHTF